jgi:RNA polymerase sigma-70 factor (ECF subfamily)
VLVLVAVHGLPYEQVAAICGCEVGTVKSRVNRARAMLKKMLYEDGMPVDPRKLPGGSQASRLRDAADDELEAAGRVAAVARRGGDARLPAPRRHGGGARLN